MTDRMSTAEQFAALGTLSDGTTADAHTVNWQVHGLGAVSCNVDHRGGLCSWDVDRQAHTPDSATYYPTGTGDAEVVKLNKVRITNIGDSPSDPLPARLHHTFSGNPTDRVCRVCGGDDSDPRHFGGERQPEAPREGFGQVDYPDLSEANVLPLDPLGAAARFEHWNRPKAVPVCLCNACGSARLLAAVDAVHSIDPRIDETLTEFERILPRVRMAIGTVTDDRAERIALQIVTHG